MVDDIFFFFAPRRKIVDEGSPRDTQHHTKTSYLNDHINRIFFCFILIRCGDADRSAAAMPHRGVTPSVSMLDGLRVRGVMVQLSERFPSVPRTILYLP